MLFRCRLAVHVHACSFFIEFVCFRECTSAVAYLSGLFVLIAFILQLYALNFVDAISPEGSEIVFSTEWTASRKLQRYRTRCFRCSNMNYCAQTKKFSAP